MVSFLEKVLSKVAVVKGKRGHEPVFEALDLIDYKTALAGKTEVLIKVNFITDKTWETGATTDPMVVEAIIMKLKEIRASVTVVESDATITNANKASVKTGMQEMCDNNGVEFLNLRQVKARVKIPIPNGDALRSITVPRIATEAAIISAAKLKTHSATKVTLGMKNMFGMLPDKFKAKYHARGISKVITDINTVLKPTLTIIDGFVAMEGNGPVDGTPVQMDLIIAGADTVATDATACRIMGINPYKVSHIRRASEKSLGNIEDIQVIGEKIENVQRNFMMAYDFRRD